MHLPNHCSCFTVLCCITLRCLWLVRQVWYWSSEPTDFTRGFTITIFVCWNWIWRLWAQRLINELLTSECVTWFILLSTPRRTVIKNGHCVLLSNGAASLHTNTTRQTHSRWWEKRRVSVCTSRSKIYSASRCIAKNLSWDSPNTTDNQLIKARKDNTWRKRNEIFLFWILKRCCRQF